MTPIAIIGAACRLPGADDLDSYWRLISERRSAIVSVPPRRLDPALYFTAERGVPGRASTRLSGLVAERPFDRAAHPIAESLVAASDPSHLAMLEVAAAALRHAGLEPFDLPSRDVGVFIGHARGSTLAADLIYSSRVREVAQHLHAIAPFGNWTRDLRDAVADGLIADVHAAFPLRTPHCNPDVTANAVAGLIARGFALEAPYQAIDAACASALYALAAAVSALDQGRIGMAIAGAASYSSWQSLVLFSQAQALSATGSFPFDARADGFVSSDGYGAVILKRLADVDARRERVLAVIRGIGVSTDGRGKSLWAPRQEGQVEAFRRSYADGLRPERLGYIEAHGTSTQLGDATEIESMNAVLGPLLPQGRKVPIASVKANIGHTCETAGMAGLIKALLVLQHGRIPPALNFEQPTTKVDWPNVKLFVPTEAMALAPPPDGGPRTLGVNCFGIGGLNAHLVIEEHLPARGVAVPVARPPALAITGAGVVFPGARSMAALAEVIAGRAAALVPVPLARWEPRHAPAAARDADGAAPRGGFINDFAYDWRRHRLPPKQLETADPLRFMIIDAVDQAWQQAGIEAAERARTAVVVGTILANDFFSDLSLALRLPEIRQALSRRLATTPLDADERHEVLADFEVAFLRANRTLQDETGGFSSSTLASVVSKTFDLMGGAFTLDAAEASSLAAVEAARAQLAAGACDAVICIGAQRYLGPDSHEWNRLRGLGGEDRPLGEGVAALVLRRLDDAERHGERILGVITALAGHTSFADADAAAGTAEARARRERGAAVAVQPMPSAEDRLGHTLGAAGLATVAAALAVQAPQAAAGALLIGAAAHAGQTYRLLLEAPPALAPRVATPAAVAAPPAPRERIIRLAAADAPALAARLADAGPQAAALFATGGQPGFTAADTVRLAIVAGDSAELAARLARAAIGIAHRAARPALEEQGIFIGEPGPVPPRVAFMFAGQGSQYGGMLRDLAVASPAASRRVAEVDAVLEARGLGDFLSVVGDTGTDFADDVLRTQLSLLLGDTVAAAALAGIGVRPDLVAGHSFGEYAALLAAGAWTLEEAIGITVRRCRLIAAAEETRGALMACSASPEVIARERAGIAGIVEIAIINLPDQIVVGGEPGAVAALQQRLEAVGSRCRVLNVPRPFHTSVMEPVRTAFRAALDALPMLPPRVPLLSCVTARYTADPDEIRANLEAQLVRPMNYVELVDRLRRDGVTCLVEVGPQQVLTRLHRRLLPEAAVCVATDHPQRPGTEQLSRVRAALECAGWQPAAADPAGGAATGQKAANPGAANPAASFRHPVLRFDATGRRRQRLREKAEAAAPAPAGSDVAAAPADEMQRFLVDFICEQTGYPREIVSLDADLEADLGIDSLRKAQLFGELRERFDIKVEATGRLALNDYPTLGHILAFLRTTAGAAPAAAAARAAEGGRRRAASPSRSCAARATRPSWAGSRRAISVPRCAPPSTMRWRRSARRPCAAWTTPPRCSAPTGWPSSAAWRKPPACRPSG